MYTRPIYANQSCLLDTILDYKFSTRPSWLKSANECERGSPNGSAVSALLQKVPMRLPQQAVQPNLIHILAQPRRICIVVAKMNGLRQQQYGDVDQPFTPTFCSYEALGCNVCVHTTLAHAHFTSCVHTALLHLDRLPPTTPTPPVPLLLSRATNGNAYVQQTAAR